MAYVRNGYLTMRSRAWKTGKVPVNDHGRNTFIIKQEGRLSIGNIEICFPKVMTGKRVKFKVQVVKDNGEVHDYSLDRQKVREAIEKLDSDDSRQSFERIHHLIGARELLKELEYD